MLRDFIEFVNDETKKLSRRYLRFICWWSNWLYMNVINTFAGRRHCSFITNDYVAETEMIVATGWDHRMLFT